MKVLIQIVKQASVSINGQKTAAINYGALYFVAFKVGDTVELVDKMITKLIKLRIFPDNEGKTNLNISQVQGQILSVSQFTLYADARGGNRPSFVASMPGGESEQLYHYFNEQIRTLGYKVEQGVFGADMEVALINEGPFTVLLDSEQLYE